MSDFEVRQKLIGEQVKVTPVRVSQSVFVEFEEIPIKKIKECRKIFDSFDVDKNDFIDFKELKGMMERLGEPQSDVALQSMIKIVDEDNDGQISFREFLLIIRKSSNGEIPGNNGLLAVARLCSSGTL
ncbi:EF-hand domain-containing protein D2 homolog [Glandiceps talaboti]